MCSLASPLPPLPGSLAPKLCPCAPSQLRGWELDALFQSPLRRARDTAEVVWGGRTGPVATLPALREIDLYSFQVSAALLSLR